MSTAFNVGWTEVADDDLYSIIQYIAADSPANARGVFERIKEAASGLERFPDRGRIVPELQIHGVSLYRELIIAPWRVIYRVAEQEVYILAVIDSRRNVEDILLQRLVY